MTLPGYPPSASQPPGNAVAPVHPPAPQASHGVPSWGRGAETPLLSLQAVHPPPRQGSSVRAAVTPGCHLCRRVMLVVLATSCCPGWDWWHAGVTGGDSRMLGTGATLHLDAGDTQPGDAAVMGHRGALPAPDPAWGLSSQPQLRGAARLRLGRGTGAEQPSCPPAHPPHPDVPSPAKVSQRSHAGHGPSLCTWLWCPSSGGHRPPPRHGRHPLASPGGGDTGSHPARPPPSPGCRWPGLHTRPGRGLGSVCQPELVCQPEPVCQPELPPLPPPHN